MELLTCSTDFNSPILLLFTSEILVELDLLTSLDEETVEAEEFGVIKCRLEEPRAVPEL